MKITSAKEKHQLRKKQRWIAKNNKDCKHKFDVKFSTIGFEVVYELKGYKVVTDEEDGN